MSFFSRKSIIISLALVLVFAAASSVFESQATDGKDSHSCSYLENIVQDSAENELSFYDARAMQLYAMGQLQEGSSKRYIEKYRGIFSNMVQTANDLPDWYDARMVSLMRPRCDEKESETDS